MEKSKLDELNKNRSWLDRFVYYWIRLIFLEFALSGIYFKVSNLFTGNYANELICIEALSFIICLVLTNKKVQLVVLNKVIDVYYWVIKIFI